VSAILALLSSVMWGISDFLGGTASRRLSPFAVIGVSQAIALAGLLIIAGATGAYDDPTGYVGWAIASGVLGLIGLSSFYAALASGTMGVVAPIAAAGVVVPIGVGLARGESPSTLQLVGAGITVLGVVMASGPELRSGTGGLRPLLLALVAAAGFGGVLVFVAEGSNDSVTMTLLVMRVVSVVVVGVAAVVLRNVGGVTRSDVPLLAVIGVFDVAANACYAVATHSGLVSLTAVLASLYPAVTVLLARRFHGERLRRVQDTGVGVTLFGVVLMAAGGGAG
jgi:drug/metabolite transporter (DMT)-like permease